MVFVVSVNDLGGFLNAVLSRVYAAARVLLAPIFIGSGSVGVGELRVLCEDPALLTATYRVSDYVIVTKAQVSDLTKQGLPSRIDKHRMPPLRKFVKANVAKVSSNRLTIINWGLYWDAVARSVIAVDIIDTAKALKHTGPISLARLARFVGLSIEDAAKAIVLLRLLYPRLIEIVMPGATFNQVLNGIGVSRLTRVDELVSKVLSVEPSMVMINPGKVLSELSIAVKSVSRRRSRPRSIALRGNGFVRGVLSYTTRWSWPEILDKVDFRGAVVADLGCGFGTKGAYALGKGARYVVLLDIDRNVLETRRSGWATDRVVGDVRLLPLRDNSVDVAIAWNVVNFVRERWVALREIRRVARQVIAYSIYNASSSIWLYNNGEFLKDCHYLGNPVMVRVLQGRQFQAIILKNEHGEGGYVG